MSGNPFIPGDFADPCIISYRDTFYVYATTGTEATVWYSTNFIDWKLRRLNWPGNMGKRDIWAPSVTQGTDGKFYFYTSADHNIYAGVAHHPMGPFTNLLEEDSIFIKNRQWWDAIHSIDADCFIDDDGKAYLYWGSGFDFKNGVCAAGELDSTMAGFVNEPKLVTPEEYFEGPHMLKRNSLYYLMYSDSLYYDSTYKVRYAIGENPLGPFHEGKNSPILKSTPDGKISGPGHHFTIKLGDQYYIVYHKHAIPYYKPFGGPIRQVCIDKMNFDSEGNIETITATQDGVSLDFIKNKAWYQFEPVSVSASADNGSDYKPNYAFDNNYGTIWSAPNKGDVSLTADYGQLISISRIEPFFDWPMANYSYTISTSEDGKNWREYATGNNAQAEEWPISIEKEATAQYVKITISDPDKTKPRLGLWELKVF